MQAWYRGEVRSVEQQYTFLDLPRVGASMDCIEQAAGRHSMGA